MSNDLVTESLVAESHRHTAYSRQHSDFKPMDMEEGGRGLLGGWARIAFLSFVVLVFLLLLSQWCIWIIQVRKTEVAQEALARERLQRRREDDEAARISRERAKQDEIERVRAHDEAVSARQLREQRQRLHSAMFERSRAFERGQFEHGRQLREFQAVFRAPRLLWRDDRASFQAAQRVTADPSWMERATEAQHHTTTTHEAEIASHWEQADENLGMQTGSYPGGCSYNSNLLPEVESLPAALSTASQGNFGPLSRLTVPKSASRKDKRALKPQVKARRIERLCDHSTSARLRLGRVRRAPKSKVGSRVRGITAEWAGEAMCVDEEGQTDGASAMDWEMSTAGPITVVPSGATSLSSASMTTIHPGHQASQYRGPFSGVGTTGARQTDGASGLGGEMMEVDIGPTAACGQPSSSWSSGQLTGQYRSFAPVKAVGVGNTEVVEKADIEMSDAGPSDQTAAGSQSSLYSTPSRPDRDPSSTRPSGQKGKAEVENEFTTFQYKEPASSSATRRAKPPTSIELACQPNPHSLSQMLGLDDVELEPRHQELVEKHREKPQPVRSDTGAPPPPPPQHPTTTTITPTAPSHPDPDASDKLRSVLIPKTKRPNATASSSGAAGPSSTAAPGPGPTAVNASVTTGAPRQGVQASAEVPSGKKRQMDANEMEDHGWDTIDGWFGDDPRPGEILGPFLQWQRGQVPPQADLERMLYLLDEAFKHLERWPAGRVPRWWPARAREIYDFVFTLPGGSSKSDILVGKIFSAVAMVVSMADRHNLNG